MWHGHSMADRGCGCLPPRGTGLGGKNQQHLGRGLLPSWDTAHHRLEAGTIVCTCRTGGNAARGRRRNNAAADGDRDWQSRGVQSDCSFFHGEPESQKSWERSVKEGDFDDLMDSTNTIFTASLMTPAWSAAPLKLITAGGRLSGLVWAHGRVAMHALISKPLPPHTS